MREKILSIPLHCANHHCFANNKEYKKCHHGELVGEERKKPWFIEGDENIRKLNLALAGADKSRLADLPMMTGRGKIDNDHVMSIV